MGYMAAQRSLSREGIEVFRFSPIAAVLIPLLALFLQASLPLRFPFFNIFNLPLLVTIFFAVARRSPIAGTVTGCVIGLAQDSLTYSHQPIGLFGISNSVVGYLASSIGVRVDVENPGSRLLMTFGFYLLNRGIYQMVRNMAKQPIDFNWGHELGAALVNAVLAVGFFMLLDRYKQRG
jgi:rod shape-determining protein MreD